MALALMALFSDLFFMPLAVQLILDCPTIFIFIQNPLFPKWHKDTHILWENIIKTLSSSIFGLDTFGRSYGLWVITYNVASAVSIEMKSARKN